MTKRISWLLLLIFFSVSMNTVEAKKKKKPRFMPYYLTATQMGEFSKAVVDTRKLISQSAFSLVGEYSPYQDAHVFLMTHDKLLSSAGTSEFGGYGAVIRVAVTGVEGGSQVSYVNPTYMTNLYHIPEVPEVDEELMKVFGKAEPAGSKKGLRKRSIQKYQYMVFMPEFDDHDKLGSFGSQQEALDTVNKNLNSDSLKLTKVFEVAVPGTNEVLIGVGIGEGEGADSTIMPLIDKSEFKHTAHLPYAVLVSDGKVYSQAGKFRIASSFPDLSMGTFMDISDAPDAIKNTLKKLTSK